MPRKSHKARGAAAHAPVGLTAGPRPPLKLPQAGVAEAEGLKVPDAGVSSAAEALERLYITPASDGDPPSPPPSHEPPAPPQQPPVEASSSGKSAAGESWEEEEQSEIPAMEGNSINLNAQIEVLLNVEQKKRRARSAAGTKKAVINILELCYKAGAWKTLNDQIILLSKRPRQFNQAITAMVQKAMDYIDLTPDIDTCVELIETLSSVCAGKNYVEIERASLIKRLAKIKEELGQIDEGANLMQEFTEGDITNLDAAIDSLLNVEKKMRLAGDAADTKMAVIDIVELCYKAGAWNALNDQIIHLSERTGQLKQKAMDYIDLTPDIDTCVELIETLSSVCAGKSFVEIERVRLIKTFAKIKEEQGHNDEAADLLQEFAKEDKYLSQINALETLLNYTNEENEMILNRLEVVEAALDASKEVSKKLMSENNLLDQKVQRLERLKSEEKSTMEKVHADECCKLKCYIAKLEQKLEVATQSLNVSESNLAARNAEIDSLQISLKELNELREFKAVWDLP